ncbi:oxidoreductase [Mycobacterium sp. djl-10]|nr:oxidoreductase [Mycobacterium sp. djl-10]
MGGPSLAVWKFASCDGCQLTLLNCESDLLTLAEQVDIATFAEASSSVVGGPYDVSLVEGSVSTPEDEGRIREIRRQSTVLVAIGACATAGGIQALRNSADLADYASTVYASPGYIHSLASSAPASAYVEVDHELRGCPIDRGQLIDTLAALLIGRRPRIPTASVCTECKRRGVTCLTVAEDIACLGPVTQAGCGALCPAHHRGCYGCFGPASTPNMPAFIPLLRRDGLSDEAIDRGLRTFNVTAFDAVRPRE